MPPPDPLIVDDRPPPPGRVAGIHALIIGVSAYPHLPGGAQAPPARSPLEEVGLEQLRAPARAAYAIHSWLLDNRQHLPLPLHSARLLLAPSAEELAAEPAMARAGGATYAEIQAALHAWRADLRTFAQSRALLFFSGHGLGGVGQDALMLPADLGDPAAAQAGDDLSTRLLRQAISLSDVIDGMASPGGLGTVGKQQVYLVDACRNRSRAVDPDAGAVPTVWRDPFLSGPEDRTLTIVLATMNGQVAYVGRDGEPTVFGQALRECLDGAAADPMDEDGAVCWPVETTDLGKFLPRLMADRKLPIAQACESVKLGLMRMVTYPTPPDVDVTFTAAGATPAANLRVEIDGPRGVLTISPLDSDRPHRLPMGSYRIVAGAITPPPTDTQPMDRFLRPPRFPIEVRL